MERTDKKLTDAEVKKALEHCLTNNFEDCRGCPATDLSKEYLECRNRLRKNALDLINQYEAKLQEAEDTIQYADKEIKRLNAENEVLERRNTTLEKLAEHRKKAIFERVERNLELRKELKTANAENESLKAEIEELAYKLGCLLCHATGGKLSKHTYPLRVMESYVNDTIQDYCEEAEAEAHKEYIEKAKSELKNISKFDFHGTYYYLVGEAFFDNILDKLVGE